MKRLVIALALAVTIAIPFALRPRTPAPGHTDDTVVVITPNNEEIRHEFGIGFERWYGEKTGRSVYVDWRVVGGTSEIARFLQAQYVGLKPDAGCGIDVFFGGGAYDFDRQAQAGRIIDSGIARLHPDWFGAGGIPQTHEGEEYRDPNGLWYGCVVSCYGIISNRDAILRIGETREPGDWADLADPRYFGEVALCDPTKSGSMAMAFEDVIQEQMLQRRAAGDGPSAVRDGWMDGLRLVELIGANSRTFTDSSQKPPIDVAAGDCAAGMGIDFYAREQQEALRQRGEPARVAFEAPTAGTAYSVDPIALLRGAPNKAAAVAFMEYVLSPEGQKLWNFKPGTPGGPRDYALRRLPIRKDFYAHAEWKPLRTDPSDDPYASEGAFVYHPEWTGPLFREMAFIIQVMCQDCHSELAEAWRAVIAAPEPARSRALAVLQDISFVDYDHTGGELKRRLESKDGAEEIRLAHELGDRFRMQYAEARRIACSRGR